MAHSPDRYGPGSSSVGANLHVVLVGWRSPDKYDPRSSPDGATLYKLLWDDAVRTSTAQEVVRVTRLCICDSRMTRFEYIQ